MPFQPELGAAFSGTMSANVLSGGPDPTTILTVGTPWAIHVKWSISGFVMPALGGTWQVRAFLESMGPGFEGQVPPGFTLPVPVTSVPIVAGSRTYDNVLAVPANPAIGVGPYKLVVTLTHVNGTVSTTLAAYIDGPILQFIAG
jgi:hypothetical protein